jgi:RNA polymerase sporulation-specific sigma factor
MRPLHGLRPAEGELVLSSPGGDSEDLIQEGLIGLYKAVRDFRTDKETSFRSFAELCVTRQIITAIKTATRFKHQPLNQYVSFSHTPAGQDTTASARSATRCPARRRGAVGRRDLDRGAAEPRLHARHGLSKLESEALRLYLEGRATRRWPRSSACDTKTIDNALQRVKRKILTHQSRAKFCSRRRYAAPAPE